MKPYEWQYNEFQQIGVDYENYEEVKKYDERMQKLRDINQEIKDVVDSVVSVKISAIKPKGI